MVGRLINPFSSMFLLVAVHTGNSFVTTYQGGQPSVETDSLFAIGFALNVTWWVYGDRRQRRYPAPFEFEAFVFFAWGFVVPYYLFKTRGWRAALACVALAAVYLLPDLAVAVADELFRQ